MRPGVPASARNAIAIAFEAGPQFPPIRDPQSRAARWLRAYVEELTENPDVQFDQVERRKSSATRGCAPGGGHCLLPEARPVFVWGRPRFVLLTWSKASSMAAMSNVVTSSRGALNNIP